MGCISYRLWFGTLAAYSFSEQVPLLWSLLGLVTSIAVGVWVLGESWEGFLTRSLFGQVSLLSLLCCWFIR